MLVSETRLAIAFAVIRKMKWTKVLNRPIAVEYEYWPLIIPIL